MMSFIHCFARNVKICHRIHPNSIEGAHDKEQESLAVANTTARYALYISYSP